MQMLILKSKLLLLISSGYIRISTVNGVVEQKQTLQQQ
jgi:hypothetical protein